ncbi:MAG TPA: hypothetical protein PLM56_09420 [Cyclobacteriaceae bacterium]|jgi:hypothetical protein|nr:hypothetical protein [Cytophagales bacterium]HMR58355.1 hypothetical protein [Cyclobacteriaceae bacterium]HRE65864.1 hypothetical protein [Cyclobacteriaceae bacterium]HRF33708.1 hypothetical protein [Cyclobacteriaceae bacterium]
MSISYTPDVIGRAKNMVRSKRIVNGLLIVAFMLGYLEWGANNHTFIFQVIIPLFTSMPNDLAGLFNPAVLIPLVGFILLLITLFQQEPNRKFTLAGLACLATFMIFLFFIGVLSLNWKIILSTTPFLIIAIISLRLNWRNKTD